MKQLINFIGERCKDIAFPQRTLCKNESEFYETINKNNGIKPRLYFSLYNCDENRNYNDTQIHLVSFDLDNKEGLINSIKLWEYCKLYNYKSIHTFSTRGFWCYIFIKHTQLQNKKAALVNITKHIAKELNLSIGYGKSFDIDESITGDLARISRLPNGYDTNRRRYCIPITIEDMKKGYEWICEKSKKQCFEFIYYNKGLLDLTPFDTEPDKIFNTNTDIVTEKTFVDCTNITTFLPCVKNWLLEPKYATNRARYFFSLYCKEIGLTSQSCNEIAYNHWKNAKDSTGRMTKYDEFIKEKQCRYAYNTNKKFPNCGVLIKMGLCLGKCNKFKGEDKSPLYR